MDYELNNEESEYNAFKAQMDSNTKKVKTLGPKVKKLKDDLTLKAGDIIKEQRKKPVNKSEVERLTKEKEKIEKEIEKLEEEAKNLKGQLATLSNSVDKRIDAVMKDPRISQYVNERITQKCDIKLRKLEIEKSEADVKIRKNVDKRRTYSDIQKVLQENPEVARSLKDVLIASREINEAKATLKTTPGDPTATAKLANAKKQLSDKKRDIKEYLSRNRINHISVEDLTNLSEYAKGDSVEATLNNYKDELIKEGKDLLKQRNTIENNIEITNKMKEDRTTPSRAPVPAEPVKWYQFKKRFQNFMARRRAAKTPPEPDVEYTANGKTGDDFINELKKFDIIEKAENRTMEQREQKAKEEIEGREEGR